MIKTYYQKVTPNSSNSKLFLNPLHRHYNIARFL